MRAKFVANSYQTRGIPNACQIRTKFANVAEFSDLFITKGGIWDPSIANMSSTAPPTMPSCSPSRGLGPRPWAGRSAGCRGRHPADQPPYIFPHMLDILLCISVHSWYICYLLPLAFYIFMYMYCVYLHINIQGISCVVLHISPKCPT